MQEIFVLVPVHILPAKYDCRHAKAVSLPEKSQREPAEIAQDEGQLKYQNIRNVGKNDAHSANSITVRVQNCLISLLDKLVKNRPIQVTNALKPTSTCRRRVASTTIHSWKPTVDMCVNKNSASR